MWKIEAKIKNNFNFDEIDDKTKNKIRVDSRNFSRSFYSKMIKKSSLLSSLFSSTKFEDVSITRSPYYRAKRDGRSILVGWRRVVEVSTDWIGAISMQKIEIACCNCSFDSVAKTGRNEGGYSTNRIDKNRETHPVPQPRFISPFYFGTRSVNKLSLAITRNGEAHFSSHFRFGNARNARDITLPRIPWNAYVYLYP